MSVNDDFFHKSPDTLSSPLLPVNLRVADRVMNEFKSLVPILNFDQIARTKYEMENFGPGLPVLLNVARIVFNFST